MKHFKAAAPDTATGLKQRKRTSGTAQSHPDTAPESAKPPTGPSKRRRRTPAVSQHAQDVCRGTKNKLRMKILNADGTAARQPPSVPATRCKDPQATDCQGIPYGSLLRIANQNFLSSPAGIKPPSVPATQCMDPRVMVDQGMPRGSLLQTHHQNFYSSPTGIKPPSVPATQCMDPYVVVDQGMPHGGFLVIDGAVVGQPIERLILKQERGGQDQLFDIAKVNMSAGDPSAFEPPAFDPPCNTTSIGKTNKELQPPNLPMCRGYLEKPFMGMNTYSSPYLNLRNGFHTIHSENSPVKPKIVTVVKPGSSALRKITLLLNRRSVQTFEQLIADISEALGLPRWKNDRIRKLYSLKGKEIGGISDFFRGDDVFIAMGLEPLTMKNIEMVTEELYPNGLCLHSTIKKNWRLAERAIGQSTDQSLKVDSGFEGSEIKKCGDAKSPRLAARHEDKIQRKVRHTEAVRVKKSDREKWHREKGKQSEKLEKNPANSKNIRSKFEDRSLNDMVLCEQCRKERLSRHKLHNERPPAVLLDAPTYNTGNCTKYALERKENITSYKKSTGNTIKRYEFEQHGKECTGHHKPVWDSSKELQKPYNNGNVVYECVEERNNHERHCIHINNGTVEPHCNTTEGRTETEKKKGSFCKTRAICRLPKNCHEDPQKPIPVSMEEKKQGTQSNRADSSMVNTKSDLERAYKNGGFNVLVEPTGQHQCSDTAPRLLQCRADVENRYEIGRVIGDGNFAIVKECRVRHVDEQYAMKIIDKSKLKGKEDMIGNEISIIKGLSHPNIVRLLDEYETDAEIFLIMEYVRGGDLFDAIIESVRFTEHDAALMMADLCKALVYIHCRNIVHRDLKPENLLIQHNPDKSTTLKLADFGLAVHVTEPIFTVCGTPTYVAPEILLEKGYGLEVDMWATGVILYILLCGFPPFRSPERDQEHLFQIIQFGQYEFTSPYWDRISDASKDLISQLLVVDPKRRYSAKQVLHHHWIHSDGNRNNRNLQREVTMNIERNFQSRRRPEVLSPDQ